MRKRIPYDANKKKTKRTQSTSKMTAVKTILPLFITLAILVLLYVVLLMPKSPEEQLKSAILNSLGTEKQKSYRFDSQFADENRDIYIDITGQKSGADSDVRIKLMYGDDASSMQLITVDQSTYMRFEGMENLRNITSKMSGIKPLNDENAELLMRIQNTWIELLPPVKASAAESFECAQLLPGFKSGPQYSLLDEKTYPFIVTAGPYASEMSETDMIYEAKLKPNTDLEALNIFSVGSPASCLDSQYGVDAPGLRNRTEADNQVVRISFVVDTLANTVKEFSMREVGRTYKISFRDYGKDVAVVTPENSVPLVSLYSDLNDQQKKLILNALGAEGFGILQ